MRANIMAENPAALPFPGSAACLVLLVVSSVLAGQVAPDGETRARTESTMTRWTIDGGGHPVVRGGAFELTGTVGQPDVALAGDGNLMLTGGFWFGLADGDCNTDGGVNLIDFESFQSCLSGPGGGMGQSCRCFDLDDDGDVDLTDVAAFQHAFTGD